MKVKDLKDWKVIHFSDNRGIMKKDLKYFTAEQKASFEALDVIPAKYKGHYNVVE